ncbi:MAG TPA: hypothetical protein PLL06_07640 [Acidobacteriota bacterium]|nr:hypothetical protein [Acidobacteriota bacterium]
MKTASWVVLALAGVLTLVFSLISVARAYGTYNDHIGGVSVSKLSEGRPEVDTAMRARRATAAAYSAGFATLFLLITLVPYRRGEIWAWWALLAGMLVVSGLILLRIPLLDTGLAGPSGGGTAAASLIQLLLVGIGLALGAGRLRHKPADNPA